MSVSYPLPSGGDSIASAVEWRAFVEELRRQWRLLWRERINDKVKAEGIAGKDFDLLFVNRGTVIVATRRFKPLDFKQILDKYETPYEIKIKKEVPHPSVGGWRKFGKEIAIMHSKKHKTRRAWSKDKQKDGMKAPALQHTKGGRGWLHIKAR